MINTVFSEREQDGCKILIDRLKEIRNELIHRGFNPPWSAIRGWEYCKIIEASRFVSDYKKTLDIGSANSIMPFYFKEAGAKCWAIDVAMPSQMELNYYKECDIDYREATIFALPFAKNFFDFIYSICVLEHIAPFKNDDEIIAKTVEGLLEAGRVLRKGGVMAHSCDFYDPSFNTYRTYHADLLAKIIDAMIDNGFELLEGGYSYDLLPTPIKYYMENSSVYLDPKEREEKHLKLLREGKQPPNLFTCAVMAFKKR